MSNALQYKASKGFRYIYYICTWWLGAGAGAGAVRHNFWEIWREVRANLPLLRGGYCVTFLLAKLISPPPPDNYCIVPKIQYQTKLEKQVTVNFAMAECCHYGHGNATESEIKNEFQTKLEKQVKMNSTMAERCHYHHATRFSTFKYKALGTVPHRPNA